MQAFSALAVSKKTAWASTNMLMAPRAAGTERRAWHRQLTVVHSTKLTEQRCEPCEASHDAMEKMGLSMIMDQETAEKYHAQVNPQWQLVRDCQNRLRIKRQLRTKNFVKALDLFGHVGELAEQEKHHPDLHLEGWNNVTIELWTHARDGLSENDFIMAAKLDELLASPDVQQLLSKKQPVV